MPTALLSVFDKTGLVDFAATLLDWNWRLLASGGTADALRKAGLLVTEIADYTGSPEILNGRVKTLHPAVFGGILARNSSKDAADLARIHAQSIDLVAVNLYPFEATVANPNSKTADIIENIDIGGVALLRAAAKNFERITVICDPQDYGLVLGELEKGGGETKAELRRSLARKAFHHTTHYDSEISQFFDELNGSLEKRESVEKSQPLPEGRLDGSADGGLTLQLFPVQELRYGENPHQKAVLYGYQRGAGVLGGAVLQGKALSYNNLLDLDAAWRAAVSFDDDTVVIVKHLSPCGIASSKSLEDAYQQALACDPVSAFGGVIAVNRPFDRTTAKALGKLFVECIAAPVFTPKALEALAEKKNLRLVIIPDERVYPPAEMRSIHQGILIQDVDMGDPADDVTGAEHPSWQVVTQRQPTEEEWRVLRFAWKAVQHAKSNAVVFAQSTASGEATVGFGSGQPNRVDCVRLAAQRAAERARNGVMASDAFFPFPDSVEEARRAGIRAIIQPGGSVRDKDSIEAANTAQIAMVFTGIRHFKH
jgi:phosphoribosylaminoimidazolecarboxamide formyltransferase/IMP cyclohydrolase